MDTFGLHKNIIVSFLEVNKVVVFEKVQVLQIMFKSDTLRKIINSPLPLLNNSRK